MFPTLLQLLASQPGTDVVSTDHPDWPYITAIVALAGVTATLFGLLMKSTRDRQTDAKSHAEEIKGLNKGFNEAMEERSKRVSEEFAKKDKAILETSVEFARLMERVANELKAMNDANNQR